jgi:hypothetical protein
MDYSKLLNKLDTSLSSSEYHGLKGSFSSSQLKTMLEDPELFYKKYITKTEEKEEIPAFDVGTYFHTAILEPHLLDQECVVYTEGIRSGKKWEAFKELHTGKAIITLKEKDTADKIVQAVKDSPVAMSILNKIKPEVSAFIQVYCTHDEIYCEKDGKWFQLFVSVGWVPCELDEDELMGVTDFGTKLILKTRADGLCVEEGFILDLKSTQGNTKKEFEMGRKVADYQYDFSAALYLDVFSIASDRAMDKFYWIFASKDMGNSRTYLASDKNIMVGRAKWKKAALELSKYVSSNWEFSDSLGVLEPTAYNKEWLEGV